MEIGKTIGQRLSRVMAEQRLTQGQVAVRADVSQPTVSALASGATKDPPISTLMKIASGLGISLDMLVGEADMPPAELSHDGRLSRLEQWLATVAETVAALNERFGEHLQATAFDAHRQKTPPQRRVSGAGREK